MRWEGTEVMVGGLVGAVNLEDWHWSRSRPHSQSPTVPHSPTRGQKATPSESPKQIQKFPLQNNSSRIAKPAAWFRHPLAQQQRLIIAGERSEFLRKFYKIFWGNIISAVISLTCGCSYLKVGVWVGRHHHRHSTKKPHHSISLKDQADGARWVHSLQVPTTTQKAIWKGVRAKQPRSRASALKAETVESRMIAGERRGTEIATTAIPIAPTQTSCCKGGLVPYLMSGCCISHPFFFSPHKPNPTEMQGGNINKSI